VDPGSSSIGVWLFVAFLVACSAFLAVARTALMNVDRSRLRELAEDGDKAAILAGAVVEDSSRFLVTLEVSQVVAGFVAVALAVWAGVPWVISWLPAEQGGWLARYANVTALILTLLVFSVLLLLFGWLVPQSLALRHAESLALRLAVPIRWFVWAMSPVVGTLVRLGNGLGQLLGGSPIGSAPMITEEAIKTLVDAGEERGVIEEDEKEMIYSVFEFGDTVVREVMVPRIDIVAVEVATPMLEALDTVMQTGYSRLPVYEETIDNIVGLLYAKDLLPYLRDGQAEVPLRDLLRSPYFIPETKKVDELLPDLQRRKVHVAIVVDEYGGVAGLVTIEDLLEEIVGEIQDEYDSEEPMVEVGEDGELIFDARTPLDDVNKLAGTDLVSDVADTLGGYVYEKLGRVPLVNDQIVDEDAEITVVSVSGRRIRRVRVRRYPSQEGDQVRPERATDAAGEEQKSSPSPSPLNLFF